MRPQVASQDGISNKMVSALGEGGGGRGGQR